MPYQFKVNMFDNSLTGGQLANVFYKNLFDCMNAATGSGIVTRIAYNSGSGAGTGDGGGFWNEPNKLGNNAWACYRFNTTSTRDWEWYALIQFGSGSGTFGDAPGNPALQNGATQVLSTNEGVVAIQAAAMVNNAGASISPWNGTTNNNGNDSKGDPVWDVVSSTDKLFVLPRSNNAGGDHTTSRENMATFLHATSTNYYSESNIIVGDEGIFIAGSVSSATGNKSINFIGEYTPFPHLSASIPTPLVMMVRDMTSIGLVDQLGTVASVAGNATVEGGASADGQTVIFTVEFQDTYGIGDTSTQPSGIRTDRAHVVAFPILLISNDSVAGSKQLLGFIDHDMYRYTSGMGVNIITLDKTNAFFGSTDQLYSTRVITKWNPNISPPRGQRKRRGEDWTET